MAILCGMALLASALVAAIAQGQQDVAADGPAADEFPLFVASRVTVRGQFARVPMRCDDVAECSGTIRVGRRARASFAFGGNQLGGVVRVRVPRGARSVHLRVKFTGEFKGSPGFVARRRLLRGARVQPGCAPAWADVLADEGGTSLWRESRQGYLPVTLCSPSTPSRDFPRVLADGREGFVAGVGATNLGWAALELVGYGSTGSEGPYEVARVDCATGDVTHIPLAPRQSSYENYEMMRTVISRAGVVVVADRWMDTVRIRLLSDTEDRILDDLPGTDPASLTLVGESVRWTRDGRTESAALFR